jgi:hypothetical protein
MRRFKAYVAADAAHQASATPVPGSALQVRK